MEDGNVSSDDAMVEAELTADPESRVFDMKVPWVLYPMLDPGMNQWTSGFNDYKSPDVGERCTCQILKVQLSSKGPEKVVKISHSTTSCR